MITLRFLLAFVLLLPTLALAVDSKDVGSANIAMDLRWNIAGEVPGTKMLKTFGYPNNTFQTVSLSSNSSYRVEKDQFGNGLLVFEWTESGPRTIQLNVSAQVDFDTHWAKAEADDAEKFASNTKLVSVDDSIATQASLLSQGASSDFEKLTRFTEWVYNVLEYDDSFWLRQPTSPEIFVERKGVCNQYSHLDMALLRAQGIPSRFVAGWVYSGKEWGPHAWTEALIDGKWIPADATYNEVDTLDGSHVVFAYGFDQADIKEELTRGLNMNKTQEIDFVFFEKPRAFFKLSATAPSQVGSNASEKLTVRLANGDSKPHAVPLSLFVPSEPKELEIKIVGSPASKLVFLPAKGERQVSWDLLFPTLEESFIYNFTLQVSSFGLKEKIFVKGEAGVQEQIKKRVLLESIESVQGLSETTVTVAIANAGNAPAQAQVSLTLGNVTRTQPVSLASGESKRVEFVFSRPLSGKQGLLTINSSSAISTHPFEIVEAPELLPPPKGFDLQALGLLAAGVLLAIMAVWFFFVRSRA